MKSCDREEEEEEVDEGEDKGDEGGEEGEDEGDEGEVDEKTSGRGSLGSPKMATLVHLSFPKCGLLMILSQRWQPKSLRI